MIAILHNIRSAHNVGSMFRTADGVGIEKIYLCGITPAPVDRYDKAQKEIAKVALGAEKTIPWESVKSTSALLTKLKKNGYMIYAVEQDAHSLPYYKVLLKKKKLSNRALIVGSEVKGLSPAILAHADTIIEIPMHGIKESLNVGVAFGIVAFHIAHSSLSITRKAKS